MGSTTVHTLQFARDPDFSNAQLNNLTTGVGKEILGIWRGDCIEEPELTLVVIAGYPGDLDPQSFLEIAPKQQERTELMMSSTELVNCLNAKVTEVATTILKKGCDTTRATSLIDTAMRTVLDADGCSAAVWRTSSDKAVFFVGWDRLEDHELYHQKIFSNPPDCIKELPSIVESSKALHFRLDLSTR